MALHDFMHLLLSFWLTDADLWCLPLQRTDAPHFKPKFIPIPHSSGWCSCPVIVVCRANAFEVGGQGIKSTNSAICLNYATS